MIIHRESKLLKLRAFVFNLSHMDTSAYDRILVAAKRRVPLERLTACERLRHRNPNFIDGPDSIIKPEKSAAYRRLSCLYRKKSAPL